MDHAGQRRETELAIGIRDVARKCKPDLIRILYRRKDTNFPLWFVPFACSIKGTATPITLSDNPAVMLEVKSRS